MSRASRALAAVLGGALVTATAALPALGATATTTTTTTARTNTAARTPIKHFVTLLQENHSFDNYFGTYPGANGIPPNVCMPEDPVHPSAGCVKPHAIGSTGSQALADNRNVFAAQYAGGAMSGFVSALSTRGVTSSIAMAHYEEKDISYYWELAGRYVLFDRYFSSAHGGSVWNHMFWMTGTPGNPLAEKTPAAGYGSLPTIFDRLQAKGISWKVYVQNYQPHATYRTNGREPAQVIRDPLLAYARYIDNPKLFAHIVPVDDYYTDLANGTLPAVSYIIPAGPSEHPPGSVQSGEAFVRNLITSLKRSSVWSTSAFMWSYDDWGGWYDHVAPPQVDAFGLGFRVPALLVSPYAKRGYVDHTQLDHTSVLKFIEDNWGLAPLSTRDRAANDIVSALDFRQPPRPAELLATEEPSPTIANGRPGIVYPAYGTAVVVALLVIGGALLAGRRRSVAEAEVRV